MDQIQRLFKQGAEAVPAFAQVLIGLPGSQRGLHTRQELAVGKAVCHVGVGPRLQPFCLGVECLHGIREQDDAQAGQCAFGSEVTAEFEGLDAGEGIVEQCEIRAVLPGQAQAITAICGFYDRMAGCFQSFRSDPQPARLTVYDQYARCIAHLRASLDPVGDMIIIP